MTTRLARPSEMPCVLTVVHVSGTIRKSEEEAIRRARELIRRAREGGADGLGLVMGTMAGMGEHAMELDDGDEDGSEDSGDDDSADGDG